MPKHVRLIVLALVMAVWAAPLFANGEGNENQKAQGLENWESVVDLNGKQAGKYNILITGTDRAGNYTFAGPINIIVDPNSDLPVVSITNPVPLMRVGGDLNIVGTCIDDDGVGSIEVKIDDEDWIKAEGTEFWSYYLSGKTLPDGRHTITVRATDIKGTLGKTRSVQFDLDRNKPYTNVDSHASGVLVAGRIKVEGASQDANGVVELLYTLDSGKTYLKLGLSPTKAKDGVKFGFDFDTTKFEDGAFVIWFKSKDRVGSVGVSPFLFFIDNTKPAVELISPAADEKVNGGFQAVFRVYDLVGLESLAWKFGPDQGGPLEFKPGNPFFAVDLKAPAAKTDKVPLTITAKDISGNVTTLTSGIKLDYAADLPVTTLTFPTEGLLASGAIDLVGQARDDDGISALRYKVDSLPAIEVPTTGAFRVALPPMTVGKHLITVSAVDLDGKEGLPVKVNIIQSGALPSISFKSLTTVGADKKASSVEFRAGIEAAPDSGAQVAGIVTSAAKVTKLSWEISGGLKGSLAVSKAQGEVPFSVPLPANGPYGLLDLSLTVVDEFNRSATSKTFVYVTDYSRIRREPEFDLSDPRLGADGKMSIGMDSSVRLAFVGEEIAEARIIPDQGVVSLERDGAVLTVKAAKEGMTPPVKIRVTTAKKHVFESAPYVFVTDDKAPELSIAEPAQGGLFSKAFTVKGSASDGAGLATLTYRVWPDGPQAEIKAPGAEFSFSPDFASLPEGNGFLEVEATDASGNAAKRLLGFVKDTAAPAIQTLTPVEAIDAEIAVAGLARDPSGVAKVEFAADGSAFQEISAEAFFSHVYNPVQTPNAKYRLTDKAGNQAVADVPHFLNPAALPPAAKGPSIAILSPLANSPLAGELYAAVRIESAAGLQAVSWTFDAQKGVLDPAAGPVWVLRLPAKDVKSKTATLKILAADSAKGSASAQVVVSVNPSALAPAVELLSPTDNAPLAPAQAFAVKAGSDYGVASISYALDGGEAVTVQGASAATYLSGLSPGVHTIVVKAVSGTGVESAPLKRSFKISGVAPSLSLSFASGKEAPLPYAPGMALVVKESKISGTASFPNGIGGLSVKLASNGLDLKATFKKISATEGTFEAALPGNLPFERIGIDVTAKDSLGVETIEKAFFHRVSAQAEAFMDEGIRITDDRYAADASPAVLSLVDVPVSARFVGRPIAKVELKPDPAGIAAVSFEGRLISLNAGSEGITAPTKIVLTTVDGDVFEWGPAVLVVDQGPPSLEIGMPAEDQWLQASIPLSLTPSDPNGIASLEWSFDGSAWTALPLTAGKPVETTLPMNELPDGSISLSFRATDKAGNAAVFSRALNKDTTPPVGVVLAPRSGELVNGYISVAAGFSDPGGTLAQMDFSLDGKTWEPFASVKAGARDVELEKVGNDVKNIMFRATDKSGNVAVITPLATVDGESDLPVVKIQLPEENEVLRADFEISGVVTDDDGIGSVYYRLDKGPEIELNLEGKNSFAIPIILYETTDNEHLVEVYAKDIFGVRGKTLERKYRISKAEPVATMSNPPIEQTVKGVVVLEGTSSDANGIARVRVSVDNAHTFNMADGTDAWTYRFDTRALQDGLHSIYVRPLDKYDTEGFFASLINIDNTDPQIILDQPSDGSEASGVLNLSGRVFDAVAIKAVNLEFHRILAPDSEAASTLKPAGKTSMEMDLGLNIIITRGIDISELAEGVYNLRIQVTDKADNFALATRTVTVIRKKKADAIDVMYPLKGEAISGEFTIHGRSRTEKPITAITVLIDGKDLMEVPVSEDGFWSYQMTPAEIADGDHILSARLLNVAGETVLAPDIPVTYSRNGPWISIDNIDYGTFLAYRPYLKGRVGWFDENLDSYDKKEKAKILEARKVKGVEVSFDNGKTFQAAKGTASWNFRLETLDYPEGALYLLIKAIFTDESVSVARTVFYLDKTSPKVTILSPRENERLNEEVKILGTAGDETKLSAVDLVLRKGDKAGYAVPSFIQGLYFDAHALGATIYEVGAGLTFFQDAVKVQGFYGQGLTEETARFGGWVAGGKLIANIANVPFSFFFGPDWEWLSANVALGAGFTYFSKAGTAETPTPLTLSSILAQLEFPVITLPKLKVLRKYSLYTEFQVWLISSDVSGGLDYRMSFGARANVF